MEGQEIPVGLKIPTTASGKVVNPKDDLIIRDNVIGEGDDNTPAPGVRDNTPDEMLQELDMELSEVQRGLMKKAGDTKVGKVETVETQQVDQETLNALVKKAQETPEAINDDEFETLVRAGIVDDDGTVAAKDKAAKEIAEKVEALNKKKPEELTDEEKRFIADNAPVDDDDVLSLIKKDYEAELGMQIQGQYTKDTDGLKRFVADVAKIKSEKAIEEQLAGNPRLKEMYQHFVVEKRSPETFVQRHAQPAFKSIKIEQVSDVDDTKTKEVKIANQKAIAEMYFQARGIAKDDYEPLVASLEETGKLFEKSKAYKSELDNAYNQQLQQVLAQEAEAVKAEEQAIEATWNKVRDTLKTGKVGNYGIPTADLADFTAAVLNPINDKGVTRMDVIRAEKGQNLETMLLLDYLLYKGLDIKSLVPLSESTRRNLQFKTGKEQNNGRKIVLKGAGENRTGGQQQRTRPNINFSQSRTI